MDVAVVAAGRADIAAARRRPDTKVAAAAAAAAAAPSWARRKTPVTLPEERVDDRKEAWQAEAQSADVRQQLEERDQEREGKEAVCWGCSNRELPTL